jgi:hypothetical protein
MAEYCVYWNELREQFHVTKTEKALKYAETIMSTGLTYDKADDIRRKANQEYVRKHFLNHEKEDAI